MTEVQTENISMPVPYDECVLPFYAHVIVGILAYAGAVGVLWLFYRLIPLALIGAAFFVPAVIFANINASKRRRLGRLLRQFQSMLDSLVVNLRAGNTDLTAFEHALEDMNLMYTEESDITKEVKLIIVKFSNRVTIGEALTDFAERCGLDDVKLFAAVYLSVEGKGDKTRDIVIRTQKILSDKIEIQAEVQTLSSGAIMEINIMMVIPVFIVAVLGFMGGDIMEGLFTPLGNVVMTISVGCFVAAYVIGKKITNLKV